MKFGVSLFGHYPKHLPSPENFQTLLRMARQARESGFDLVHAGHHFMVRDFQKFQVVPALSRVSAETEGLLISVLDLAPLNHPVRLAEEIATMDAMTNGHIVFTPAMGYVDHDFETFGVPKKERRGRYLETIEIVKRLWTQDDVTFEGRYYRLHDVTINPKPVQKPRPPIWQPADALKGVIRAAEYGDVWLISNHGRLDEVKTQLAAYREHYVDRSGEYDDHGIKLPMMRICSIGQTMDEAMKAGRPYVEDTWKKFYGQFGQAKEMDNPEDFTQEFDSLWKDRFVFGTPDDAIRAFERYERELGVDLVLLSMPGSAEEKLRCMKLLGEAVIPHFKSRQAATVTE